MNNATTQGTAILSWLRRREDELAPLPVDLVAIPRKSSGEHYLPCLDVFETSPLEVALDCEHLGPSISRQDAQYYPKNLFATYGGGERFFYFHAHYDAVPALTSTQFYPLRKENFLLGRASSDMKGGIVARLYAIRALKQFKAALKGKIWIGAGP